MFPGLVFLTLLSTPSLQTDKVAHFGVSYALTHTCQVLVNNIAETDKTTSTIICVATTLVIGATKELLDPKLGGNRDIMDMTANILGVGLAVTIISIDW